MKVGFLLNQIDNRGTGNATFDYAHYNEVLLGNESKIFTFMAGNHDKLALHRYHERFGPVWYAEYAVQGIDVLYHVKSGENDGYTAPSGTRYAVHAVFNGTHKHGDKYVAISEWLGQRDGIPHVSHILALPSITDNLRERLGIPSDARVFGRHGGFDTFDVPFVWSAISKALAKKENIYFLFLNTRPPDFAHERMIFLPQVATPEEKKEFINTCDVMLHARVRGETFGIAVGEFSISDKPIITYALSGERAHFDENGVMYTYTMEENLVDLLTQPDFKAYGWNAKYKQHTPENVMREFKEQFLD